MFCSFSCNERVIKTIELLNLPLNLGHVGWVAIWSNLFCKFNQMQQEKMDLFHAKFQPNLTESLLSKLCGTILGPFKVF
jgi:hypothetical protein